MKTLLILFFVIACSHNPYKKATPEEIANFREVRLPFPKGTEFFVATIPFADENKIYAWNFDVPFGTPVTAMEKGKVVQVWEPGGPAGCDKKFALNGSNIQVLHDDGTVAQYLHTRAKVNIGDMVKEGQVIATTANSGHLCVPQLHVSYWAWRPGAGDVKNGKSIPVRFKDLKDQPALNQKMTAP